MQEGQAIAEDELIPMKVCTCFTSIFWEGGIFLDSHFLCEFFYGCSPVLLELVCYTVGGGKENLLPLPQFDYSLEYM